MQSKLFGDISMMENVGSKECSFFFGGRIASDDGVGGRVEVNTISMSLISKIINFYNFRN